jgi:hypothetical protein
VTSIGDEAFAYCTSLNIISIPTSVTFIGEYAFDECMGVTIYCEYGSYAQIYAVNKGIPFVEFLLGDINHDRIVNFRDYAKLIRFYKTNNTECDLNNDGIVNMKDLSILISNFGETVVWITMLK